jgi:hypothetical protein
MQDVIAILLSVQPSPKICLMRFTSAFFVPGLRTLFNQCDFCITICFGHGTPCRDFFLSKESIMADLYGINAAPVTKKV